MRPSHKNKTELAELLVCEEILAALDEGVYFTDQHRKILYWNKAAERITGYPAREVVGSHCWDNILMHVDQAGRSLCHGACPLTRSMRFGRKIATEAFLTHRMGHRLPVTIRTIPLRNKQGRVAGAVEIFSENPEEAVMRQRLRELEKQSLIDPLTGLSNRRGLELSLRARFDQKKRFGWGFGLLFMDIDGFKAINDTYGHECGDEVLRLVARNMISNSRSFDLPGRWGGDELMVISENVDVPALQRIAERHRTLIETCALRTRTRTGPTRFTVSIGATLAKENDTMATLLRRADKILYTSKNTGKNKVTLG